MKPFRSLGEPKFLQGNRFAESGGIGLGPDGTLDVIAMRAGMEAMSATAELPEGTRANLKFVESTLDSGTDVDPAKMLIAADAQTSGGLLLCLDADATKDALAELSAEGHNAAIVGVLESPTEDELAGRISLRP